MRRPLATAGFVAAAVLSAWPAAAMIDKLGPGEGEVSIVAWPGYIERGETDKAYDWVTEFETKTGCKVSVKTAGTSDEMVALMMAQRVYELNSKVAQAADELMGMTNSLRRG